MRLLLGVYCYAKKNRKILGVIAILSLCSSISLAQNSNTTVSYEAREVRAGIVLHEIEKQTEFTLTYNQEEINNVIIKKINWNRVAVQQALKELEHYGITYSITGNNIALKLVDVRTAPKPPATGKVTGKVLDEETGEPLNGVTIKIGNSIVASDIDGSFSMRLPKGKYTAVISSVGYGSKNITDVEIKGDQVYELNLTLKKERGTLAGVVVSVEARKETAAALYARQKNSAGITDGISAEQISQTPDKNVGESLKRITGLSTLDNRFTVIRGLSERYSGAMLNGQLMPSTELNRKNFSFDLIPTSMVENITVIKTLTPDLSAEFGGGLVEVNTIDIPSRNFFTLTAGGGFNDNTSGKPFLSMQLEGKEYLGQVSRHRYLFGSLDWKSGGEAVRYFSQHGSDPSLFTNNWGITSMKPQPNQNYQLSIGRTMKAGGGVLGLVGAGSYRNNFNRVDVNTGREGWTGVSDAKRGADAERYDFSTNIAGMLGLGYRKGNHRLSIRSLYLRTLNQQLLVVYNGGGESGGWGMNDITTQSTLWQTQVKGEHQLSKQGVRLNWSGSYIYLNKLRPDNHVLRATVDSNAIAPDRNDVNVITTGDVVGINRWWSRALEKNYSWETSVTLPFQLAGSQQLFKGGIAGWSKDRSFYVLNATSGTKGGGADGFSVPLTSLYGPDYSTGNNFIDYGDSMHKTQTLHALYGMFDNRLGTRWRLVWGLRAEYVDQGKANAFLDKQEELTHADLTNWRRREKNWQFFPSANLTYGLTSRMNLRLAYARSIIRPDLRELAYFHEYDFELGGVYGGTAVRSTLIDHYDFRYEWYPSAGDVISVTGFYKRLQYPMEVFQEPNHLFVLKNSKAAKNYGVEMEVRKSMAFTGVPVIRNLTLYGNFTFLDGRVRPMDIDAVPDSSHPGRTSPMEKVYDWEKRPQAGAGNYIFNAGVFYDSKLFSANVVYNSLTNRLVRVQDRSGSLSTAYRSVYERPLKSLDAQLALHLLHRQLDIKLNVANLLNSFYVTYVNNDTQDEHQNITKKQMEFNENLDAVDYKAANGRTYSFTITWSFR